MRRLLILLVLILLYGGGYVAFRAANTEVWARDGQRYVIFPADGPGKALYYLWRPLSYVDARATGVQAHLGPHRA